MTRYYGWYASRTRGVRRRQAAGGAAVQEPVAITDPVNWSLRAATAARRCCGASTKLIPSRARGVPRRCASWPSSPTRRSSPASSCTGPGASNAPSAPAVHLRPDTDPPPSPRAGRLGSPFPFRPAPHSGSGAPRRARRSPPVARRPLQHPAATRAGPEHPRLTRVPAPPSDRNRPAASLTRRRPGRIFGSVRRNFLSIGAVSVVIAALAI